ncbi:hypothetical protein D9611_015117 [Ephemerocybe angulata]|uniref:HTH CENPB-type domain-containing protein n=1 Tax=Ephemerocybe angulata TaxID=980116 RepID=A0A8H5CAC5_9AGAR|nr:hypothetical protein D9611_015117 [Tulosesus angulatus]
MAILRRRRASEEANYENRVQAALAGLKAKKYKSKRQAAEKENVALSTLSDRANGKHKAWGTAFASRQLLKPAQETVVVDWVRHNAETGRPFHSTDIKNMAYEMTGEVPGKNWMKRFAGRHPELVNSRPAKLDPKRATNFNKSTINDYFQKLASIFEEYGGIPPEQIWNMDEKGIQLGGGRNKGKKKYVFLKDMRDRFRIQSDNLELATTTHKTQPLDVVIFTHVQTKWSDHCQTSAIMKRHIDPVRPPCFTTELVEKAFEKTGIYPLNPDVFTDADFAPSKSFSSKMHVPESFPDDIDPPSSEIPTNPEAGDESDTENSPQVEEFSTQTDANPDVDMEDAGEGDGCESDSGSDSSSDCDSTVSTTLDDDDTALDTSFSSATTSQSQSTAESNFRSLKPPAVRSAYEDERLAEDPESMKAEIEKLRDELQKYWDGLQFWKSRAEASAAHCTMIKRELAEAREQIANLEKKKRRGSKKTLARVLVHHEYVEEFKKQEAERLEKENAEAEKRAQKDAAEAARVSRMAEETRSRIFSGSVSSYKRDDWVVLARALGVSDSGNMKEVSTRVRDYISEHREELSENPRFSGLNLVSGGRRQPVTPEDQGASQSTIPAPLNPSHHIAPSISAPQGPM